VPLATYYEFADERKQRLLGAVLDLVCPCYQRRALQWVVLDRNKPPRLGDETQNGRLGINSYLGGTGSGSGNGSQFAPAHRRGTEMARA